MSRRLFAGLRVESLERRNVPATMTTPTTVTYQDTDGDQVLVKFSKPLLTDANVNSVFAFDVGSVSNHNLFKQQLQTINVSGLGQSAAGLAVTVTATRSSLTDGDGFAAVGHISAQFIDLGVVKIDGDLGRIRAGDPTLTTSGLKGLSVQSIGRFGTSTGAPDLFTTILGKLEFLNVKSDVNGARIVAQDSSNVHEGRIGTILIGGSLIGGPTSFAGSIRADGDMGLVTIRGSVMGGLGDNSGLLQASGRLAGLKIGGSVIGGIGSSSGRIITSDDTGFVSIQGNLVGSDTGLSGSLVSNGALAGVMIGGSVIGGGGALFSGRISSDDDMGFVTIRGNFVGGSGKESGTVHSDANLAGVRVGGAVRGGAGEVSGRISCDGNMGPVRITGDLVGGSQIETGSVSSSGRLGAVTIGGSVTGAAGTDSGRVFSTGDMGLVSIRGDLIGGNGGGSGAVRAEAALAGAQVGGSVHSFTSAPNSAMIRSDGDMGFVTIGGDLMARASVSGVVYTLGDLAGVRIGGSVQGEGGDLSGAIRASGDVGFVTIRGDLLGSVGAETGAVIVHGKLAGLRIDGSVRGGLGNSSGWIGVDEDVGSILIGGDLVGGSSAAGNLQESGYIHAKRIASLTIGGSLIAGTDNTTLAFTNNGAVRVDDDIGSVLIKVSIVGNRTNAAVIAARGRAAPSGTTDVAIGSLRVRGSVEYAQVLAGFHVSGIALNADAQIGSVMVGGDWIASSVAAGATAGPNGLYGDGDDIIMAGLFVKDDPNVASRIGSFAIGGQVAGTTSGGDHYGVVAQVVAAATIGSSTLPLTSGSSNDHIPVSLTDDFAVNEV